MLRRWRGIWARRGKFLQAPPATPTLPGIIEQSGSRPRWAAKFRRGRFWGTPAANAAPGAWGAPGRAVRRLPSGRRGDRFDPPWPQPAFVPRLLCAHRPPALRPRRGRFTDPPWTQVVQQPSVWPPGPVVARRRAVALPRIHGRRFDPPWPFVPPPPSTVGVLTATDTSAATLTAGGTGGPTVATDSTGLGAATDQGTGRLTATDKAGGPS